MALTRILYIDLEKREGWVEEKDYSKKLLGGRGLASLLLYHNIESNTDPLSPDNPLVIAPGLLTGSGFPTASKTIFAARSPLTGFLGRSAVGALLGAHLKWSHIDATVVKGSLDEPGILVIDNGMVSVRDAGKLWGLRVSDAEDILRKEYKGYGSCVIGPAGENLSRIADIDCNGRQAGRTGLGAVMGSKKLKAIVVKGNLGFRSEDPVKLKEIVVEWSKILPRTPSGKSLIEFGTPAVVRLTESQGVFPSLNWKRSTLGWCSDRDKIREEFASFESENRVSRNPCPHCNRPCSQVIEVMNPFGGGKVRVDGPEYEVLYSLGSNVGLCDPWQAAILSYMADELGFDAISLGAALAWAIELNEKGLLGEYAKGYEGLTWGSTGTLIRLVEDMAYRRSRLGELLADGVAWAVKKFRWGMDEAVNVKGLDLPAYDARGLKGMALGYAVASRGGDHLTSGMYALELGGSLWIYENVDPLTYENKPVIVQAMENLFALYDALGICKFSRKELPPEKLVMPVNAVLGAAFDVGDLLLVGERIITLERIVNLEFGLKPSDDTLPPKLLYQAINDGPRKGELVDVYELNKMIREYYSLRGWNRNGVPYRETLIKLGLEAMDVKLGE
ncbi:MAG: aldehyde ferredoxin oxidoreductase family protein [Desulfurococcales archaeon]|nr:aldehyde ferredoxin oxidoreductase family protein [Desulfurococcales archaeon]